MKTYPLSLDPRHCSHWDILDAIRELCQNQLDAGGGYIDYNPDTQELVIGNENAQIPTQYLLIGAGSKKDGGSRGVYGEGSAIAWLILTREGHEVSIKNGNVLWTPYYAYSELFGSDMLHVDEVPLEGNNNVEYTISGITQEDYDEVVARCAFLREDIELLAETKYGNILTEPKGKLFVGGLYVCDTDMEDYSYDIKPEHLQLNRDRKSPENFDLKSMVRFMWQESDNKEEMVDLILNGKNDAYLFDSSCHRDVEFEGACYNKAVELYGEGVALAVDDEEKQSLYDEGYRNIVVTGKVEFNRVVRRSKEYIENVIPEEEPEEEITPVDVLEKYLAKHRKIMSDEASDDFQEILNLFIDKSVDWGYNHSVFDSSIPF